MSEAMRPEPLHSPIAQVHYARMLLAGVDGDLGALAQRHWRELPEPERVALKAEARFARREFSRLHALTGRW